MCFSSMNNILGCGSKRLNERYVRNAKFASFGTFFLIFVSARNKLLRDHKEKFLASLSHLL